jgi:hypothetical protein
VRYGGLGCAVVSLALCPARDDEPQAPWLLCGTEDGAVHVVRATGAAGAPLCVLRTATFHLSTVDLVEPLGDRLAGTRTHARIPPCAARREGRSTDGVAVYAVSKGATDGRLLVWDVAASVAAGGPVVLGALAYVDTDIFFIKGSVRRLGGAALPRLRPVPWPHARSPANEPCTMQICGCWRWARPRATCICTSCRVPNGSVPSQRQRRWMPLSSPPPYVRGAGSHRMWSL